MKFSKALQLLLAAALSVHFGFPARGVASDDTKQDQAPGKAGEKKNDDKKSESEKAGGGTQQNLLEEWAKLSQRKRDIAEKLQQLQKDFATADDNGKRKIRDEFKLLVEEFQRKLAPRMEELGPKVYQQKPNDVDAAEVVMRRAYTKNRYLQAAEIADRLTAANHATRFVVNIAGVSHFAIHDFEKARKILEEAAKKGQLDDRLARRFLQPAADYVELWKKEQEIRKREAAAKPDKQLPRVLFKTSRGDVELELFENEAPNTVANFVSLVEAKMYDGTKFHRVIPNFMAQGGDPNSVDDDPSDDGQGGPGYTIKCECFRQDARMHFRGSISMAHAGKDTGGSQFFLTHLPTYWLNPSQETQSGHTVFGRIVKGMDVVAALEVGDKLVSAKVLRKRNHEYKPEVTPDKKPNSRPKSKKKDGR